MENQILSHATEQLIPGLSYTLGPTAQFVRSRQATTFFPSGGNQYSINGVRVLRFELQSGGDMFLDPATIRLAFTLKNLDAAADHDLKPLGNSPLCLFQRLRVLMKGGRSWRTSGTCTASRTCSTSSCRPRGARARRCRCWATSAAATYDPVVALQAPWTSSTFCGRR